MSMLLATTRNKQDQCQEAIDEIEIDGIESGQYDPIDKETSR